MLLAVPGVGRLPRPLECPSSATQLPAVKPSYGPPREQSGKRDPESQESEGYIEEIEKGGSRKAEGTERWRSPPIRQEKLVCVCS